MDWYVSPIDPATVFSTLTGPDSENLSIDVVMITVFDAMLTSRQTRENTVFV